MPVLHRDGDVYLVETDQYRLALRADDGTWADLTIDNVPAGRLYLPGAVDTDAGLDVTVSVSPPVAKERADYISFTVTSQSSHWASRVTKVRCRDGLVDLDLRVKGQGAVNDVHLLGGFDRDGQVRSTPHFNRVFNPAPNGRYKQLLEPDETAYLTALNQPDWQGGASYFSPAPLCYCVRASVANWLALSLCAQPGHYNFEDYIYDGTAGFELRLGYAGHTTVDGEWTTPRLLLVPGPDEYDALQAGSTWRCLSGSSPHHNAPVALWWRSPIFCGWGEQVGLARVTSDISRAPSLCTQVNYERWLGVLDQHGLNPGIIVIDDKWQDCYGDPRPDRVRWPDMRGFIRDQHERGRHVLLWWKAWDPEGVPPTEQIQRSPYPEGSVDPTNRAYWRRLRASIEYLMGELGADGFKLGYTHRVPYGPQAQAQGQSWGIELLRDLIAHISDAAKEVKPDALITASTPDPYFANIVDMIRLNEAMNLNLPDEHSVGDILTHMTHRARVARAAGTDWLIDTDNWPCLNRSQWLSYVQRQPYLGIPSLYYATQIDRTGEALQPEDYQAVAQAWRSYLSRRMR